MVTEYELHTIVNVLSFNFNVISNEWFDENQFCIIIIDKNNTKNNYRILINTKFNVVIFQYINDDSTIIDLNAYIVNEHSSIDVCDDIVVLIISILNYYMNVLVYAIESE